MISAELQLLIDHRAIVDLTIAYTWALDTRDFAALHDVFAPDATADLREVICADSDAIVERISHSLLRLDASQHLIGNQQVRIEGDTATCRCQLQSQHIKLGTPGGDLLLIGGVYDDRLERRPEGWRIVHRVMRQTWIEGNLAVIGR
jgi:SnoaL-like domain